MKSKMAKTIDQTTVMIFFVFIANLGILANPNDPASAEAGESEISYGMDADLNNKYLWRGIIYDDGFVIQPDVWVSCRNFTLGVWSNLASRDDHQFFELNEIDLSLSYRYSLLNLEIENSFLYYRYPRQPDSPPTGEFYVTAGIPFGDFKCFTNFSIDVVEYPGAFYVEHGMEIEKTLTENLGFSSSINLGWASIKFNEAYVGASKTAVNMLSVNLSLNYYPIPCLYFQPHVQINRTIDKDLYETLDKCSSVYGLLIGMEF